MKRRKRRAPNRAHLSLLPQILKPIAWGFSIVSAVVGLSGLGYKEIDTRKRAYVFDYRFARWEDANEVKHWGNWKPENMADQKQIYRELLDQGKDLR